MVFVRRQITRFAVDIIYIGLVFLLLPQTACLRISQLATRKQQQQSFGSQASKRLDQ